MTTPREILEYATTVAVVGASTNFDKPGGHVPQQLMEAGFHVIPVNPREPEVFGLHSYASLSEIPEHVDVVEVFRPAEEAPALARQAAEIGARAVWLQEGIVSEAARRIAEEAGLDYVEDRCMGVEQSRYGIVKRT